MLPGTPWLPVLDSSCPVCSGWLPDVPEVICCNGWLTDMHLQPLAGLLPQGGVCCRNGCMSALRTCMSPGLLKMPYAVTRVLGCLSASCNCMSAGLPRRHLAGLLLRGVQRAVPRLSGVVSGLLQPLICECLCSHWKEDCCLGPDQCFDCCTQSTACATQVPMHSMTAHT